MGWLGSLDGSLTSYGLVFLGGLVSGLSPCVLPTVALVVAYVGGFGRGRARGLFLSAGFSLGFAATLAALGFGAAAAGGLVRDPVVISLVAAVLCLFMGLVLLGVVSIEIPGISLAGTRRGGGFVKSFLLGIPFAFVSSPCTTPVTVAVLGYAASRAVPLTGAALLFAYGLGRSVPLLVAGGLAGAATSLVVSATWSSRLKWMSGTVLVAVGLYLLWRAL